MAGNHGDEYEGQVAVTRLAKDLQPEMLQGRVILLPMANFPAAKAGYRTSPVAMATNRSFLEILRVTKIVASYIESGMRMADYAMISIPAAALCITFPPFFMTTVKTPGMAEVLRLTEAFTAPFALHYRRSGNSCVHSSCSTPRWIAVTVEMGECVNDAVRFEGNPRGIEWVMVELGMLQKLARRADKNANPTPHG